MLAELEGIPDAVGLALFAHAVVGKPEVEESFGHHLAAALNAGQRGPQFLVGSVEEHPEEEVTPDAFNEGTDFDFVERISRRLAHRVPAFTGVAMRGGYASLYDVTPDWQPILGPVPEAGGLFVAAGFSGHGFKLSPAIGEALAGLISEGRFGAIDLKPFRPSRFSEGALIHSPYVHGIVG